MVESGSAGLESYGNFFVLVDLFFLTGFGATKQCEQKLPTCKWHIFNYWNLVYEELVDKINLLSLGTWCLIITCNFCDVNKSPSL